MNGYRCGIQWVAAAVGARGTGSLRSGQVDTCRCRQERVEHAEPVPDVCTAFGPVTGETVTVWRLRKGVTPSWNLHELDRCPAAVPHPPVGQHSFDVLQWGQVRFLHKQHDVKRGALGAACKDGG
jgi:hypothetical protein